MALGDLFPVELINTTDLAISRPTFGAGFADATGAPAAIASGLSAIAVPRQTLTREPDAEQPAVIAEVILDPRTIPTDIRRKDVITWSDFYGAVTEAEVVEIERHSGVDGLESVSLKVGRRSA